MAFSEKYKTIEAAQLRALVFLFAALLALGSGNAFAQRGHDAPEKMDAAHQLHTQSCDAALLAGGLASAPSLLFSPQWPGHGGLPALAISSFSSRYGQAINPCGEASAAALIPKVRRCILFSCQRLADPPPSL